MWGPDRFKINRSRTSHEFRSHIGGNIIPAYVKADQAALLGFVRRHLSFLRTTSLNRMIKAIEKPQNKLFDRLYLEILNFEDGSYICLSNDVFAKGKSQEQIESAINRQLVPSQLQEGFPYFTNPLLFCEKRGREYIGRRPWKGSSIAGRWC